MSLYSLPCASLHGLHSGDSELYPVPLHKGKVSTVEWRVTAHRGDVIWNVARITTKLNIPMQSSEHIQAKL